MGHVHILYGCALSEDELHNFNTANATRQGCKLPSDIICNLRQLT